MDPVAGQYYWHRFYSHQPDLNFDNPRVLKEVLAVLHFWLDLGIDGLRLDAVPYLVEREGTNNENLAETHAVLRQIRSSMDAILRPTAVGRSQSVAGGRKGIFRQRRRMQYGIPLPLDATHVHGHCSRGPVPDHRYPAADAGHPPIVSMGHFSRNHDELTLEMVTNSERDYLLGDLCRRSSRADQPGHPPAIVAASGTRPAPCRADELSVILDAGHAGDLLRRRNGHGGQYPLGRPGRRPHPDAMVA